LHSDSSYRFERRIDPEGLDWASRRCCELILELADGELASGLVDVGQPPPRREPITLRLSQLKRILGIDVPVERVREILVALGNEEVAPKEFTLPSPPAPLPQAGEGSQNTPTSSPSSLTVIAPSWRRDLTREIDLIEEVARIHGYETIPEDVGVPMVPSARTRLDRVLERVRRVLTSAGFDEALTLSVVDEKSSAAISPWTDVEPLRSQMPVIRGANCLRRSLMPSLLHVRQTNEALANAEIELFEIAKVYLPQPGRLPQEELMLAITSGRDYPEVKGVLEAIVAELKIKATRNADNADLGQFDPAASCRMILNGKTLGYVGRLAPEAIEPFDLRGATTVAEIKLSPLIAAADLVPQYVPQSLYPAVTRDLNLVVDESVRWADVAATVREHSKQNLEGLVFQDDSYRDPKGLGGEHKKSLLFTMALRSPDGTLTNQQADAIRDQVVAACCKKHDAKLRA
jgi:phenylalanyl-tRNA synthetase beta chain